MWAPARAVPYHRHVTSGMQDPNGASIFFIRLFLHVGRGIYYGSSFYQTLLSGDSWGWEGIAWSSLGTQSPVGTLEIQAFTHACTHSSAHVRPGDTAQGVSCLPSCSGLLTTTGWKGEHFCPCALEEAEAQAQRSDSEQIILPARQGWPCDPRSGAWELRGPALGGRGRRTRARRFSFFWWLART